MVHRYMSLLEIVVRLMVAMVIVLLSWGLDFFPLYLLGVFLLVTAMSGYCPFNKLIAKYMGEEIHS